MKKQILQMVSYCLLIFFLANSSFGQSKTDKIDVLIIDGFSNHDWKQTTHVVKNILEGSGLFNVSISTAPAEPDALEWNTWRPKFKDYDVVIQNTNNIQNKEIRWPKEVEKSLEKYVKSGGGLNVLHSANNAFPDWDEYNLMIGLGWRLKEEGIALQVGDNGEILEIPRGEGKDTYHGPRRDQVVHILNRHPINNGFPNAWKTPNMELYKYARGAAKNLSILSYAEESETKIKWPVEWVVSYGKGSVYNSTLGHLWKGEKYPDSYRCIGFQTTLIRATEWLATGNVSYEVPGIFPTESEIKLVGPD